MTERLFFLSLYRLAPIPILKEVSLPWVVSVHLVEKVLILSLEVRALLVFYISVCYCFSFIAHSPSA